MITNAILNLFAAETIDPIHPRDPALARMFGMGQATRSGMPVNEENVMGLPAVMRAVNIISNGIMKLPWFVYEENDDDSREYDMGHASWTAIRRKANPEVKASDFRQTMTAWAMIWGNAVAVIDRPNWPAGPVELYPLLPDRTFPIRWNGTTANTNMQGNGTLMYATRINNEPRMFLAEECLHIRGLGNNPYWGYNIVDTLKETFGGAMAVGEHGHRLFGQGAQPTGFVRIDHGFDSDQQLQNFLDSLRKTMSGLGEAHKLALLEQGAEFQQFSMPNDQAQFLETKQFDVRLLAMALGIKTHKLIDSANTSYNSLEQANQEHKEDDLMPWICRWRDEYDDKMLTEEQKATESHSIDTDEERLEWVPFKDRAEGVAKLHTNHIVDQDEARRKVNYGPSKGANGKRYVIPVNLRFDDEPLPGAVNEPTDEPSDDETDTGDDEPIANQIAAAYMQRVAKRIGHNAQRKAKQGAKAFIAWLDGLETETGPDVLQESIALLYEQARRELDQCTLTAKNDEELVRAVEPIANKLIGDTDE